MGTKKEGHRGYDYFLLIPTLALLGLGLVAIYSASSLLAAHRYGDGYYFLKRQGVFCLLGLLMMILAKNISPTLYRKTVYPLLGFSLVLLLLLFVPGFGVKVGGATRWLSLGVFAFQPSELVKLALAFFMAYSMAKKGQEMTSFTKGLLPHIAIAGLFMGLILIQPDLGTCIIIGAWLMILLFVGGVRLHHVLSLVLLSAPILWWLILHKGYRWNRWKAFLNPWEYPLDLGYQIIHSLLAIGSGGIFGVGLGNSKQKLFYLPEPHTDFILPIVAEELGLVGITFVVALFSVLIVRGIKIALTAGDLYSSYLAMGISSLLGLQAVINMAVVMGLLPTKGLTLPFMSYGGSSLVISLVGIGILMSISARR